MTINTMEQEARLIVETLISNGFPAFFVGGCVRDRLLGRTITDMDITTRALPEQVMAIFERCITTGIQHGTVVVLGENHPFEVTTFRTEGNYEDFRRPSKVHFVSDLNEDLARRDFTINAMAFDLSLHILDPFGGRSDLEQKIVRTVGDSSLRFKEDALRMLRCIRFSAQLGFRIDKSTWEALQKCANLIQHIAMERVGSEVMKIISSSQPVTGLKLLLESGLISHFKSQLFVDEQFWKYQLSAWDDENFAPITDDSMRWAVLFTILQYDHKSAQQFLRKLKVSNSYINEILALLQFGQVMHSGPITHSAFIDATINYSRDVALKYIELGRYLPKQFGEQLVNAKQWIDQMPAYSLSDLKVSGKDLIDSGIKPGQQLGRILQDMLSQVARKQLPNEYEALVKWARHWRE